MKIVLPLRRKRKTVGITNSMLKF